MTDQSTISPTATFDDVAITVPEAPFFAFWGAINREVTRGGVLPELTFGPAKRLWESVRNDARTISAHAKLDAAPAPRWYHRIDLVPDAGRRIEIKAECGSGPIYDVVDATEEEIENDFRGIGDDRRFVSPNGVRRVRPTDIPNLFWRYVEETPAPVG